MICRFILPLLLVAVSITAQSEEFLRLKQELEDRIARLRPEAREVADRLKAVFKARLPKEEAKARLNAVLESASDVAKSALETLKPDRKIDPEVVIHLPEEPVDEGEAEMILERIAVPGIDRIAAAADRLNLTEKTLAEALRNPSLAAQLGVDRNVLDKIEHLAAERGLANNTVENVLHTLRYNLSLIINPDERSRLEKFAYAKNITSLEQLFEMRLAAGELRPNPDGRREVDRFRNASDVFVDDFFGGRHSNRSGEIVDRFFNGTDRDFVDRIRKRFGNDSSFIDKIFSNATGDFGFLGVLMGGNSSLITRLFNGTDSSNGALVAKIKEAFKNGNFSAILNGSSGNGSGGIVDKIKSLLKMAAPGVASPSDSSTAEGSMPNFGSVIPPSLKNLLG